MDRVVSGLNAQGDHLILTPDFETQTPWLIYSAESRALDGDMMIQACNPTSAPVDDGNTDFHLLVIANAP